MTALSDRAPGPLFHWGPRQMPCLPILKAGPEQHPYRVNPTKPQHLKVEIDYMLQNKIIEPSSSDWSSPCILVSKPDGTYRFCTDFRKLNAVTKADSFPLPRIEDCIDKIGRAKYVTTLDLLKGYWQVPLTDRDKELSTSVTPLGLYQYRVMPFGMKNAPATFQRMVNRIVDGLQGCNAYIHDLIIYADSWQEHLKRLEAVFERLSEAELTVEQKQIWTCRVHLFGACSWKWPSKTHRCQDSSFT